MLARILAVASICMLQACAAKEKELQDGFLHVTCGSTIKLNSVAHQHRLHSHEVTYGTGSAQQSVTGMVNIDDHNSYWLVRGTADNPCQRSARVKCGAIVRLTHYSTKKNLHTHLHRSPLSGNQEVSCFGDSGEGDAGDYWEVVCPNGGPYWARQTPTRLLAKETRKYLATNRRFTFGNPIQGQLEVHAKASPDADTEWLADEGLYLKAEDSEHTD